MTPDQTEKLKGLIYEYSASLTRSDAERELQGDIAERAQKDMCELSDYQKYRGKCKEMVDNAVSADPTLRAVRGHYHCPMWGEQPHWWCERPDGSIYDPSAKQFPFGGEVGEYVEFNGMISCAECGKEVPESEAKIEGRYGFCSTRCTMRFVGL